MSKKEYYTAEDLSTINLDDIKTDNILFKDYSFETISNFLKEYFKNYEEFKVFVINENQNQLLDTIDESYFQ